MRPGRHCGPPPGIDDLERRAELLNGVAALLAAVGQPGQAADAAGQALRAAPGIGEPPSGGQSC